MKGVPIRIEVGPRDVESNNVVFSRRDNNSKHEISIKKSANFFNELLEEIQINLFNQAKDFKDAFGLREVNVHSEEIPSPIVEMAMEHQHQDSLNGFTAALV